MRFDMASSSLFLASQRHKIASVGLGRVAKNVTYRLTFNLSANNLQSFPCLFGGSSSRESAFIIDGVILNRPSAVTVVAYGEGIVFPFSIFGWPDKV